ncbi:hypothetical protein EMIHUDRAFT_209002 [Emiliania huxleyi CCMP1516]|uniref:Uncharacterized protein n=2 Tax=Emiliania huxleyi TaxID=2903 RepID=A0A0D3J7H6_EMIH1|nr:hypothetical protein EMIHUDRAFT_209002 [Emiliania huxleyi CCMP1516]EOD19461.1 hypothetical protein EMIHUDRAFT_209002 [Emiliania huxleyi CCMP1516]|eukprot:XP_005771890.1 hypothetical protein EMIHUDRAFT_209002 [Emiliania huxleyi CCMP1516]
MRQPHTGIVADGYRSLADNEPAAVNVTGPNGAPVQGAERPMQRDNYDRDFY